MKAIEPIHIWKVTPDEAVALQVHLADRVQVSQPLGTWETVAGCDISYDILTDRIWAAVVVVRKSDSAIVEQIVVPARAEFPYVPGLLSFREAPVLLQAFAQLQQMPDVVVVDGQGIAHPRRFGLACHLGLWLDLPCLGCAKSWLIGDYTEPPVEAGAMSPLHVQNQLVGAVVRSATNVRPVFVSPGHKIDVHGAVEVVRGMLSGYRHPIPTRLAHIAGNAVRSLANSPDREGK